MARGIWQSFRTMLYTMLFHTFKKMPHSNVGQLGKSQFMLYINQFVPVI